MMPKLRERSTAASFGPMSVRIWAMTLSTALCVLVNALVRTSRSIDMWVSSMRPAVWKTAIR